MSDVRDRIARAAALFGAALVAGVAAWYASLYRIEKPTDPRWWSRAEDFFVYWNAAGKLLQGADVYLTDPGVFPYIYPPFAAICALLLRPVPWPEVTIVWAALNGLMCLGVLHRLGVRKAWHLGFGTAAALLLLLPLKGTLEFGQLGVLLLWLVVLDLVDPPGRRWLPQGILIGIATGLKLTPGAFIVYLLLTRRFRAAAAASAATAGTILLGLIVMPSVAWGYWMRLLAGDSGAHPSGWGLMWNISVTSAMQRVQGVEVGQATGLWLSLALLLVSMTAACLAYRSGAHVLALTALGIGSTLANPVAWAHHLTWVLPGFLALARCTSSAVRWIGMICLGLLTLQPQLRLPGSPWEKVDYSPGQLWLSALPDLAGGLFVVTILIWAVAANLGVGHATGPADTPRRAVRPSRALVEPLDRRDEAGQGLV